MKIVNFINAYSFSKFASNNSNLALKDATVIISHFRRFYRKFGIGFLRNRFQIDQLKVNIDSSILIDKLILNYLFF